MGCPPRQPQEQRQEQQPQDEHPQEEPVGLVLDEVMEFLSLLHRGTTEASERDSHICFAYKDGNDKFANAGFVTLSVLETGFTQVAPCLERDGFFTINGMYKTWSEPIEATGLPNGSRKESNLRYLNAIYADLDIGREEGTPEQRLTIEEARSILKEMIEKRIIPTHSLSCRSGRGVYLFWLLHDEKNSSQPQRAWPEKLQRYKQIQREIIRRLHPLAADKSCVDAARILRVPGTIHRKTNRRAKYKLWNHPDSGQPASYTLEEMAELVGLPSVSKSSRGSAPNSQSLEPVGEADVDSSLDAVEAGGSGQVTSSGPAKPYGRSAKNRGAVPKRANGNKVRDERRARDLDRICDHRGGWRRGERSTRLYYYAKFLRGAGNSEDQVHAAIKLMAAKCQPPFPSNSNDLPLKDLVAQVFAETKPFIPGNDKLCSGFGITLELVEQLGLESIKPSSLPRPSESLFPGGKQGLALQERRRLIVQDIEQNGVRPSRTIAEALGAQGVTASHVTIAKDLTALGYKAADDPQRKAGRPRKEKREAPATD